MLDGVGLRVKQEDAARICSISYSKDYTVKLEESTLLTDDAFWQALSAHINDRQWATNCRFSLLGRRSTPADDASPSTAKTQACLLNVLLYAAIVAVALGHLCWSVTHWN